MGHEKKWRATVRNQRAFRKSGGEVRDAVHGRACGGMVRNGGRTPRDGESTIRERRVAVRDRGSQANFGRC